jgi:hypothetical protein
MVCWRERRTSKIAFLGINRLAVPMLPALVIALAADALIWSFCKQPVAWELHIIAALSGLTLALFFSLRPPVAVAVLFLACAVSVVLSGCTINGPLIKRDTPLIQRTAPMINVQDVGNGSANGNTVTPMQ